MFSFYLEKMSNDKVGMIHNRWIISTTFSFHSKAFWYINVNADAIALAINETSSMIHFDE